MVINAQDFVATFPEFAEAYDLQPEMIERAVLRAQAYVSQRIWGDRYEAGVYQKTAHLLAMGGLGENLRIDAKAATAYGVVFTEMVQALPMRMIVSGGFGGAFRGGGCP